MRLKVRVLALATALALSTVAAAGAGTISIAWEPVDQATGYRVYYGTQSRQYDHFLDVGHSTSAVISDLDDCTDYYVSVKAYSPFGESTEFSDEIAGWARPSIEPQVTVTQQGSQLVMEVQGANFDDLADVTIDAGAVPVGEDGTPLVSFGSFAVTSCNRMEALITVEPTAMGFQPMPLGVQQIGLELRNPDGVFNTGAAAIDVQFNPARADVNRLYQRTVDRVDGDDLAMLARAWASSLGQHDFEFACDMDGDTDIDGDDLALMATVFGQCRAGSSWSVEACL